MVRIVLLVLSLRVTFPCTLSCLPHCAQELGPLEVKHGLMQLAEALSFIHRNARLIHRGISPEVGQQPFRSTVALSQCIHRPGVIRFCAAH